MNKVIALHATPLPQNIHTVGGTRGNYRYAQLCSCPCANNACWLQVHKLCQESAERILNDFHPNLIIAIGGGGYVPARILRYEICDFHVLDPV
jgi:hypothetical protein